MRILLSGGTGTIGSALRAAAEREGHETGLLVRGEPRGPRQWRWDAGAGQVPPEAIAWADAVVNLSGAPIGRLPWTKSYRRELVKSRVEATRALATAIAQADAPPSVLANGSAVGYYGDRPGERLDESSGPGKGFLSYLCRRWEAEAREAASDQTRVVLIRTGIVLADDGALAPLMLATGLGAGARMGPGTQVWPWISLEDEVGGILHAITHDVSGPVNLVAPARSTSEDVTRTLAAAMNRPHLFTLPSWLLRIPLGPAADEVLLLSQHIEPAALLGSAYEFRTAELDDAIANVLRKGDDGGVIGHGSRPANERNTVPARSTPSSIKKPDMYEALREDGASKEKAARISNAAANEGKGAVGRRGGEAEDYDDRTVAELRARAKELGLTGYSGKTKAELIEMLRNH